MSNQSVIKTCHLSIGYRSKKGKSKIIHESLDLELRPYEVTCLLGLNGAGKSTLLRTLAGFQPALGGEVFLLGKPLQAYSQPALSLTMGVVLTEKTYAGGITVAELVSLGRHPYTGFFGRLKKRDREVVDESLAAAGITHKAQNYVSELSDGERQKVMIAKALAQECPIIILDEPTAFLDVASRIETMVLLRKLAKEQQKTILLSTHDMDSAIQMGDCLWLMSRQRPVLCGAPEDLILNGAFERYLGKEGLVFDLSTGKLSVAVPVKPMGVEGDFITSYWVGNALMRNGWCPSPAAPDYINIHCESIHRMIVILPTGKRIEANSIANLLTELRKIN
jgi:iron complex transport system ATP-binding protein